MSKALVYVKGIKQKDSRSFTIEWSDDSTQNFNLSDLQQHCPCAQCRDNAVVNPNVSARRVVSVGRYALRVEFTSGCSNGIFDFDYLRGLAAH